MTVSRSPTLAEVLNTLRESISRDLHVSMPARVLEYDAQTLEVTVQPVPADSYEDEQGKRQTLKYPAIVGVPFGGIEAGGCHVRVVPQVGDMVTLVFTDRSLDGFLSARDEGTPLDGRRHSLTDAIAYPLFSSIRPAGLPSGVISLGANTGLDDFVALAAKVKAALDAISTWAGVHVHSGGTISGSTGTSATPLNITTDVASTTVSVRG